MVSFADETAKVTEQTALDLAAGERQSAARRMQSLRGSAGQIGALELAALAGELEVAIERGAMDWVAPLAALDEEVRALIAAIAAWQQVAATGAGPAATASAPPPLDPAGLADLRAALRAHDLKALRRFDELEPALRAVLGAAGTAELRRVVHGLRVPEALTLLEAVGDAGGRDPHSDRPE